ncbi:uncharacterized protein LOC129806143 [Phlebotomus papatasi]|uniref:uncharacterized protein LOC129806143 n=1 Tax=Phlebotomus papatasi TaxID=29031 RepID=UPI002483A97F|nr:uncharacterized protein LOC129806143 [Phlebotomus papatasi]
MFRVIVIVALVAVAVASPLARDAAESSTPADSGTVQEQESPEMPEKPGLEEPKPTAEPEKPGEEAPAQEPNPVELKPPPYMPELPHRPTMDGNRRVIFYDQRQSGKYNIRADLDNFMILVIPTSPSSPAMSGASILDFLSRGAMRRSQAKHAPKRKKGTKIHKVSVVKNDPIEDHAIEIPKDSPIHTIPPQSTAVDHFIEGRTPYKVDISSTARTDPEARIDLMPAAKTPVLRIIRPEEARTGNLYRSWSFPGPTSSTITFRNAKSLPTSASGQLDIATNSVATSLFPSFDSSPQPDSQDEDLPDDTRSSFDSLNVGNVDAFGVPDKQYNEDWEWKLLGAQEQCGPDRKRDSYGICQFVPT